MELCITWIRVQEFLDRREQPVQLLQRELAHGEDVNGGLFSKAEVARIGTYWVPQGSVLAAEVKWSMTRFGDGVRIPVHGYRTASHTSPGLFAAGLQVMAHTIADLQKHTRDRVTGVALVLGDLATSIADTAWEVYVGIALRTDSNY